MVAHKVNLHPRQGTPNLLPPVASARQLTRLWDERDARYAIRTVGPGAKRHPLTENEKDSIRTFRRMEAEQLEGRDRSVALATLSQWRAPAVMR